MFRLCFWKGKELSHCLNRKYFRTSRLKSRKMTDIFSHTPTAILQYCMIAFHVWIIMNFPNVTHYPFFWLASYFTRHSAAKWLSCNCDFEMVILDQTVIMGFSHVFTYFATKKISYLVKCVNKLCQHGTHEKPQCKETESIQYDCKIEMYSSKSIRIEIFL